MPTRDASGWRARSCPCWADGSSSWCTITTTSHGRRPTTARSTSWCARARRRRFRGNGASWAAPWETTRSSSKAPDTTRQRASLYSTVHGAGRVMSRTEARGKVNRRTGELIRPGRVTWEMLRKWVGEKGVTLRGGGLDESPQAYRRLPDVLTAQGDTVNVLHTLTPLIVVMAGENEFDPYRD